MRHTLRVSGPPSLALVLGLLAHLAVAAEPAAPVVTLDNVSCARRLTQILIRQAPTAQEVAEVKGGASPFGLVDKYLQDPRFHTRLQQLAMDKFRVPSDSPFPYTQQETEELPRFLVHLYKNNLSTKELLTADYGLNLDGSTFKRQGAPAGILRNPYVLTMHNGGSSTTNEFFRFGEFRRNVNRLFGAVLMGAHFSAATVPEDADLSRTGTKSAACAGCHHNPYFGVDQVGVLLDCEIRRQKSAPLPAECSEPSTVLGEKVADVSALAQTMANSREFPAAMMKLFHQFLLGRSPAVEDVPDLQVVMEEYTASGYQLPVLVRSLLTHNGCAD